MQTWPWLKNVFQNYREAMFPWMRTIDNIAYPLKLEGRSKAEVDRRMAELAGLGRAGEVRFEPSYPRFAGDGAAAGDDVDDAIREANGFDQFGEPEQAERRFLRRLQHHGAAAGQRRRDLPRRSAAENSTARWRRRHRPARAASRLVFGAGRHRNGDLEGRALDLGRPAGIVSQPVDGAAGAQHAGDAERFAVLDAFDLGKQVGIGLHRVGEFQHQVLAIDRPH